MEEKRKPLVDGRILVIQRLFARVAILKTGNMPQKYLTDSDTIMRQVAREMLEKEKADGNKDS